jgi:hypothetical protein
MLQTTYLFQMQQLQFLDLPHISQFLQITIKIFIALKKFPLLEQFADNLIKAVSNAKVIEAELLVPLHI